MVGGAPLSEELAKQFGADGYAEDASGAVIEAKKILRII
jgi:5-methyltetrahydrofolate--homocysteine methyltransferase